MTIYSWGLNEDGQCSNDNNELSILIPRPFNIGRRIDSVSCGSRHSLFLSSGIALSTGWGFHGQLGHGVLKSEYNARVIDALSEYKITSVSAGGYHSGAVSEDGRAFVWGGNNYGQIGLDIELNENKQSTPSMLTIPKSQVLDVDKIDENKKRVLVVATSISCGGAHTIVLLSNGTLWGCGRGIDGQLGVGRFAGDDGHIGVGTLRKVKLEKKVIAVACGAFHSAAITSDHELYTWGKEDYGVLGHGSCPDAHTPRKVDLLVDVKVEKVVCGGWHTLVISDDHKVYAWGRGEYGRLGLGDDCSKRIPTPVTSMVGLDVIQVAAGGTHSIFLTSTGEVYACGRGQYGRIGTGDTQTRMVPEKLDMKDVTHIDAGGTHSIAITTSSSA